MEGRNSTAVILNRPICHVKHFGAATITHGPRQARPDWRWAGFLHSPRFTQKLGTKTVGLFVAEELVFDRVVGQLAAQEASLILQAWQAMCE